MTLKSAKAKRANVTTQQELRSLRRWVERAVRETVAANERTAIVQARCDAILGGQRVLLQHFERVLREKDALVKAMNAPQEHRGPPVDFEVTPRFMGTPR